MYKGCPLSLLEQGEWWAGSGGYILILEVVSTRVREVRVSVLG